MRKVIAACCVMGAGITAAYAQSTVTIYGIVDLGVMYNNKVATSTIGKSGSEWMENSGVIQQSRFGFKGVEDLGSGNSALFVLEGGYAGDTGASGNSQVGQTTGTLFGRAAWVGLANNNVGTLQIGRRKDFTDQIATDFSSVVDFGSMINGPHDNNVDRVGGNRSNNMVSYYSPTLFGGLVLNASYGFGESSSGVNVGNAYGLGAEYKTGGFAAGFGYWTSKVGATASSEADQSLNYLCTAGATTQTPVGSTCLKTFNIGSSYTTGPFRFFGMFSRTLQPTAYSSGSSAPNFSTTWTETYSSATSAFSAGGYNNSQTNVIDLGVNYNLTPQLKLTTSFIRSRNVFVGATSTGSVSQLNLGADYALSKRTDVYVVGATQRTSNMYAPGIMAAPGGDQSQFAIQTGIRTLF